MSALGNLGGDCGFCSAHAAIEAGRFSSLRTLAQCERAGDAAASSFFIGSLIVRGITQCALSAVGAGISAEKRVSKRGVPVDRQTRIGRSLSRSRARSWHGRCTKTFKRPKSTAYRRQGCRFNHSNGRIPMSKLLSTLLSPVSPHLRRLPAASTVRCARDERRPFAKESPNIPTEGTESGGTHLPQTRSSTAPNFRQRPSYDLAIRLMRRGDVFGRSTSRRAGA